MKLIKYIVPIIILFVGIITFIPAKRSITNQQIEFNFDVDKNSINFLFTTSFDCVFEKDFVYSWKSNGVCLEDSLRPEADYYFQVFENNFFENLLIGSQYVEYSNDIYIKLNLPRNESVEYRPSFDESYYINIADFMPELFFSLQKDPSLLEENLNFEIVFNQEVTSENKDLNIELKQDGALHTEKVLSLIEKICYNTTFLRDHLDGALLCTNSTEWQQEQIKRLEMINFIVDTKKQTQSILLKDVQKNTLFEQSTTKLSELKIKADRALNRYTKTKFAHKLEDKAKENIAKKKDKWFYRIFE